VKICGLRRAEDLEAARDAGADLVGLVFAPSRRRLDPEAARNLLRAVPEHPPVVGVFVNATSADINDIATFVGLSMAQLSGQESPEEASLLQVPCLKTIHLRDGASVTESLHIMSSYPSHIPILLEAWSPLGGGSGIAADWDVAQQVISGADRLVLLAGGLHPGNVRSALERTSAKGVDVSSGVEIDGWKDADLIHNFVRAARTVESQPL
jgi:phosphoribosylanthranilate isomerase